jgi:hypothetical protein
MKIYQVSTRANANHPCNNEHQGFCFAPSKSEAFKIAKDARSKDYDCQITAIHVTPNKQGIIKALNIYAGHPDNG